MHLDLNNTFDMNRLFKFLGVVALIFAFTSAPNIKASAQFSTVSFQTFYDELSPYGQWMNDPYYGYVWRPQVGGDFQPYYTGGRWAMTEYGNTWVSDYDWGWAPFHYGRWTFDNYYGWLWIPGNEWGPAWVSWRQGGGYYGWAPMGPGININVSFGNNYYVPDNWWVFIPNQYIYAPNYGSYWRGPRYNNTIIYQTTYINNVYNNQYVCGPSRRDVERYTGRVNVYNIRNANNPRGGNRITNNSVSIFRPTVIRRETSGRNGIAEAPRNAIRPERSISRDNIAAVRTDNRNNNFSRSNETINRAERNRTQEMSRDERMPSRFERDDRNNTDRFRTPQSADRNMQNSNGLFERRNNAIDDNRTAMPERREPARQEMMERQQWNNGQRDYNAQRMEQYQAQRNTTQQPQRQDRPQREWRRPEPQQQPQQQRMPEQRREPVQRMERPQQMQRPQQMERRQQMERPQSMPQQRNDSRQMPARGRR